MLGSITPLGERSRGGHWRTTVSWYLGGTTVAGAAAGWTVGSIGSTVAGAVDLSGRSALGTLAILILAGAAVDARLFGTRLPTVHRQVNEDWLHRYRAWVYGVGFGLQLGVGVVTIVTISAVYGALAAAFLSGSGWAGAAIGAAFGFVRGGTVLTAAAVEESGQLVRVDARLRKWDGAARRLAIALEVALAATAVALAFV